MGLFGFGRRELVEVPADTTRVAVGALSVRTAESLVIISLDAASAPLLADAARSRRPHTLVADGTAVNLVPVRDERLSPAHDPDLGWIIPLTPEVAQSLADLVATGPGAHEIEGLNLAVVVD